MGGAWEWIIRSIRKMLRALLGQQLISDEMLRTMMFEVQAILNSRYLTQVSSDPKDLDFHYMRVSNYYSVISVQTFKRNGQISLSWFKK